MKNWLELEDRDDKIARFYLEENCYNLNAAYKNYYEDIQFEKKNKNLKKKPLNNLDELFSNKY